MIQDILFDDLEENQVRTQKWRLHLVFVFLCLLLKSSTTTFLLLTTSLALTFSHSKVFTHQLPTDTLPLVTAGAP